MLDCTVTPRSLRPAPLRLELLLHIILDVLGLTRGLAKRVVNVLPSRLGRLLHVGFGGGVLAWTRVSGASATAGLEADGEDVGRGLIGERGYSVGWGPAGPKTMNAEM
jgi:hypothetical protein